MSRNDDVSLTPLLYSILIMPLQKECSQSQKMYQKLRKGSFQSLQIMESFMSFLYVSPILYNFRYSSKDRRKSQRSHTFQCHIKAFTALRKKQLEFCIYNCRSENERGRLQFTSIPFETEFSLIKKI